MGGRVHDESEWSLRLQQDADWIEFQFSDKVDFVYAAVVFAHANPSSNHQPFIDRFLVSAASFDLPVLFIHGDGHRWIIDRPWPEENILRVQVDQGGIAPPVQVTTSSVDPETFAFDREPF